MKKEREKERKNQIRQSVRLNSTPNRMVMDRTDSKNSKDSKRFEREGKKWMFLRMFLFKAKVEAKQNCFFFFASFFSCSEIDEKKISKKKKLRDEDEIFLLSKTKLNKS